MYGNVLEFLNEPAHAIKVCNWLFLLNQFQQLIVENQFLIV